MEILGSVVAEVGTYMSIFFFSKISTIAHFHGNLKSLQNELEKLDNRKNEIEEDIGLAETEGKYPTTQVSGWIKIAEEIEREVVLMLEEGDNTSVNGCSLVCDMHSRFKLSKRAEKKQEQIQKLLIDSYNFQCLVVDRKPPIKPVERKKAPSLSGQKAAQEKIEELMGYLIDDGVKRIAIWGMGGIGKTTLAKNLNNLLESFSVMVPFDIVIWVTVSKDMDFQRVQSHIAERLNLVFDAGGSTESRALKLHQTLMRRKFLLILDDVWEKLDLDIVGIPEGDDQANGKILLTTRNLDVCRGMMTNVDVKMDVLSEDVAWNLFAESAGKVVESDSLNPLARAIARKCCGLPLAIKTMGKSMRNKTMIELWKNALYHLQHSSLHVRSITEEVYLPLKLSYNSLPSKIHQWCFLYCSLYPENVSIKTSELIHCWIADGLIDDNQSLEQSLNNGIALVENLKDSCLLEQGESIGTVKMHGVVRDLAIWISKENGFFCQAGTSLSERPCKLQKSFTRISFMNSKITRLPNQLFQCTELTALFLQGNPLEKIPDNLFLEVRALRVLNLSCTPIKSLPPSLLHLGELRALLLRNCCYLEKLPLLGDLYELQVLDLFGTRLRELPWKKGMLSNLRELNLSNTHHMENVEAGTILGLASLEILDMSFSAYKWESRCNVGKQSAAFDELLELEQLSELHIRLDTVDCLSRNSDWLKRLRKFNIRISPRSCDSNYLPVEHDEKRVILRGVDLMRRGLDRLFCYASALDIVACGGSSNLSEVVSRNNLCGLPGLKSLAISSCDSITSLINGEAILRSMLPNLEHLELSRLRNLATILEGMVPKGGCLNKLKTIQVVNCRRLKNLISFSLLRQLKNLEEIRIGDCRRIRCLIAGTESDAVLPKLKVIKMWDMANLRNVCPRTIGCPVLETIDVNNCPVLVSLPISACNAATVKEIRGDLVWWNNITWEEDSGTKSTLQQRFQARRASTTLRREHGFVHK